MGDPGLESWIASLRVSRVRTSPTPGDEKASGRETGAGSGMRWPALLVRWDLDSASWRTCQLSLDGEWTLFSETFPTWGTMRSGALYRLPTWAPRTSASAFSSWRTPCARDHHPSSLANRTRNVPSIQLAHQAAEFWPTPNVPNGGRTLPPEAVAAKGKLAKGKAQIDLGCFARLWPTPKGSAANYGQPREDDWGDL